MSYAGGKEAAGTFQKIINLMPPHDRYFEPFLGNGAIMRHKRPAAVNVGLDLDFAAPGLVWMASIAGGGEVGRRLSSESAVRSASPILAGAAGIVGVDGGGRRWESAAGDAFKLCLEARHLQRGDLVYCDPPYLMETRKVQRRRYRFEFSRLQHRHLLRCLLALPCFVMVSGYWSELYAETLRGWNTFHFEAVTRGGSKATEWVWFNFERPAVLHDYQHLGADFRERERIKRKQRRWVERLARMSPLERQALLLAIQSTEGKTL